MSALTVCQEVRGPVVGLGGSPFEQPGGTGAASLALWTAAQVPSAGARHSLRKHRFERYLAAITGPSVTSVLTAQMLRRSRLPASAGALPYCARPTVVALMLKSRWNTGAHDGSESRIGKPYPWSAKELKLKYISALVTCRIDMAGSQVCYQAPPGGAAVSDRADILSDRKCSVAMLALYDRHKEKPSKEPRRAGLPGA